MIAVGTAPRGEPEQVGMLHCELQDPARQPLEPVSLRRPPRAGRKRAGEAAAGGVGNVVENGFLAFEMPVQRRRADTQGGGYRPHRNALRPASRIEEQRSLRDLKHRNMELAHPGRLAAPSDTPPRFTSRPGILGGIVARLRRRALVQADRTRCAAAERSAPYPPASCRMIGGAPGVLPLRQRPRPADRTKFRRNSGVVNIVHIALRHVNFVRLPPGSPAGRDEPCAPVGRPDASGGRRCFGLAAGRITEPSDGGSRVASGDRYSGDVRGRCSYRAVLVDASAQTWAPLQSAAVKEDLPSMQRSPSCWTRCGSTLPSSSRRPRAPAADRDGATASPPSVNRRP
jgi:hypothetical protein